MSEEFDAEQVIREVSATLQKKLPEKEPAKIERAVRQQVEELRDRPVRDYVSVLAARAAKKQLTAN